MTYDSHSRSDGFPADGVELVAGEKYEVIFDGVKYECTAYEHEHGCIIGTYADEDEATFPFYVRFSLPDYDALFENTIYFGIPNPAETVTHTFEVARIDEVVHKLDVKYLPEPDMVITIAKSSSGIITVNDVTITSGTKDALSEKIWAGALVDVRIRYICTSGSYRAEANEIKATCTWYAGRLYICWGILSDNVHDFMGRRIVIEENGEISAVYNTKVALVDEK